MSHKVSKHRNNSCGLTKCEEVVPAGLLYYCVTSYRCFYFFVAVTFYVDIQL